MKVSFDNYNISVIRKQDALGVHELMCNNKERFKRYFSKTLEENITLEKAKAFSVNKEKAFENKDEFLFVLKNENKIIGLIYIKELDWTKKQGEFAYGIASGYEGKGLTSKAVSKLSQYAFENLGLEIFQIIVYKDNIASVKVAENCNFIWQRTLLKEYTPPNESPLDMELYELYKK
jgi:ribosomal-protein-alanine N-acetyltransferase